MFKTPIKAAIFIYYNSQARYVKYKPANRNDCYSCKNTWPRIATTWRPRRYTNNTVFLNQRT